MHYKLNPIYHRLSRKLKSQHRIDEHKHNTRLVHEINNKPKLHEYKSHIQSRK